jgi:NitT/TauT family transport system permease protein
VNATIDERAPAVSGLDSRIRSRRFLVRFGGLAVLVGLWEWFGRGVSPIFFSYPTAIASALPEVLPDLTRAAQSSLVNLAIGFAAAVVIGVFVGLLMGRYRLIEDLLDLEVAALYATPSVALIPVLILWFGLGNPTKIAVIFLSAFFPILLSTQAGVRDVSQGIVDIGRAEGSNERQIFTKIILPAAVPFIMTGIRLAIGRAVVGMVVGEFLTAITGLGGLLITYGNQFQTARVLVVVAALAILGTALTAIARRAEQRFARWKITERAA